MKKKWLAFLLVGVFLVASLPSSVMAAELVTVTLNDKKLDFDVSPILENGRVLVPWKEDNITLIANKSLAKEKYLSNSVITSIMIKKENKNFEIMFTEKPLSISSVGLSANKDYLALKLFYHYGYKVLVVNLNTGEHFMLNDMLKTAKNGFVETIHAYSWSPDKNKLAFAFGNTSKSNLAIYDLDKNFLSLIPTENDYITIAYILWHRNGEGLDFVSEYPPNKFKLYRYFNNQDSIEFIRAVSREEIVNMPSPNYRFKY
ncbi:Tol biopolymer transport system component [Desulfohalotomaculum tongense]|uniref:hypothetical protein n=1 Tax=Desulforadius tongensis TaxID=1216062 RepID=UPI0019586099|nr:hypothetical protein [Desulforadius tongensis]MBM7855066.1 Tol biopolymer transport system component [Desulforadius tongensis]